jgi:death on curing protein
MRYLTLGEVLEIHAEMLQIGGGMRGIRDVGALESAIAQPQMTFGGSELYSGIVEKAAALGFSLIQNHPFIDGNKRVGHAAMETYLVLNGYEIEASVDIQEQIVLDVASGKTSRESFTQWLSESVVALK